MKLQFTLMLFVLCLNFSSWMAYEGGFLSYQYGYTSLTNITQVETTFNATRVVESWQMPTYNIPIIGDIVSGLFYFFNAIKWLIAGFPSLLMALGAPPIIYFPVLGIWLFLMFMFVVEFISGRRMD